MPDEKPRCQAVVYRRDCYRMSRGRGFTLRYDRGRCKRAAVDDGFCRQHFVMDDKWPGCLTRSTSEVYR